ncbi:hypothetical protein HC928_00320 [bacterium]|nr:hypothetical protein [bacterium]
MHGKQPVGKNYLYAVFASLRTSPKFLIYWNASHMFSRIVNRMAFQQVPIEEVETQAFEELARTLSTREDVKYLVDYKLRATLLRSYESGAVAKSLTRLSTDDFGIAVIRADLTSMREDETEFSQWLQGTPMHDTSPAQEQQIAEELQEVQQPPEEAEAEEQPSPEGAGPEEAPQEGGEE